MSFSFHMARNKQLLSISVLICLRQSTVTWCQQGHKPKQNTGSGITWQCLVVSGNQGDLDYINYYRLMK